MKFEQENTKESEIKERVEAWKSMLRDIDISDKARLKIEGQIDKLAKTLGEVNAGDQRDEINETITATFFIEQIGNPERARVIEDQGSAFMVELIRDSVRLHRKLLGS